MSIQHATSQYDPLTLPPAFAARPLVEQVVLACARAHLEADQRATLATAARTLSYEDWRNALQFAEGHGLTPLLWFHLAREGHGSTMPASIADELRLKYQTRLLTQMRLASALRAALATCQAANIPALVFKGPELSLRLYGFLGPRPSGDIDILFPPEISQRAIYRHFATHYARWEAAQLRVECTWNLIRRPPYRASFPSRAIWQAAQPAQFAQIPCLRLGPRDELRYLCAHFAMHNFGRYIWLADIAELLRHAAQDTTWDWAAFTNETIAARVVRPILQAFRLAQTVLDAPAPAAVLAEFDRAAQSPAERNRWSALNETRLTLRQAAKFVIAAGAWRAGLDTARRLIWPDRAYLYDCHDWAPGSSVLAARRRRWSRMMGRIWHTNHP